MDFQPTDHITETQAIGDDTDNPSSTAPQMAAPLSVEHAALRADIEIITSSVLEQFAQTIYAQITKQFAKNNTALQNSTNSLTVTACAGSAWKRQSWRSGGMRRQDRMQVDETGDAGGRNVMSMAATDILIRSRRPSFFFLSFFSLLLSSRNNLFN